MGYADAGEGPATAIGASRREKSEGIPDSFAKTNANEDDGNENGLERRDEGVQDVVEESRSQRTFGAEDRDARIRTSSNAQDYFQSTGKEGDTKKIEKATRSSFRNYGESAVFSDESTSPLCTLCFPRPRTKTIRTLIIGFSQVSPSS
jgi:hypothetical protein